jgi:hypothetical protein
LALPFVDRSYFLELLLADMAAPIPHFIASEFCMGMVNGMIAGMGHRPMIAMVHVVVVIHMPVEIGRSVKTWASADERTARKPFGPVQAPEL